MQGRWYVHSATSQAMDEANALVRLDPDHALHNRRLVDWALRIRVLPVSRLSCSHAGKIPTVDIEPSCISEKGVEIMGTVSRTLNSTLSSARSFLIVGVSILVTAALAAPLKAQ